MTDSDILTIPSAAFILKTLREKPREQIYFSFEAMPILFTLMERGFVTYTALTDIQEQNVWTITPVGLNWLERHSL